MSANTTIEWATKSWNPVRGCSRVSPGCDRCYAMGLAHRFAGPGKPYEGLTTIRKGKVDWSGTARFIPPALDEPLTWRKAERVFVNSMSDLFHHSITFKQIAAVFGVMAACSRHTFLVLTKRPDRAAAFFDWLDEEADGHEWAAVVASQYAINCSAETLGEQSENKARLVALFSRAHQRADAQIPWPLPNVHLGVSVESQDYVHRIAEILKCPASVHWVSLEPLLGPVDVSPYIPRVLPGDPPEWRRSVATPSGPVDGLRWGVVGTESGPGARPAELAWLESLREQFAGARVPFFTKQIANEHDRKGGDPKHWPGGPWPREFPTVTA